MVQENNLIIGNHANDRALLMTGIDVKRYHEGYNEFKIEEL